MANGTVKWFSDSKGYGFLVNPDPMGKDIFVHYSSIKMDGFKTLKAGEDVEYELVVSDRGPQAANVCKK